MQGFVAVLNKQGFPAAGRKPSLQMPTLEDPVTADAQAWGSRQFKCPSLRALNMEQLRITRACRQSATPEPRGLYAASEP